MTDANENKPDTSREAVAKTLAEKLEGHAAMIASGAFTPGQDDEWFAASLNRLASEARALLAERDVALVETQQYILSRQERERAAFQAGAEAMREAAIRKADNIIFRPNLWRIAKSKARDMASEVVSAIRALPLPERKP